MIKKPKRLAYILNVNLNELTKIIENIDSYYYEKKEVKHNLDGTIKYKNGEIQYRILIPSKGRLKYIQNKIKIKILSKIDYPSHIQGGVKKRDNITNAKKHLGKKYHFCSDISKFFPFSK